jgi:LPXTG-motif cell wall-anchored protein
MNWSSLIFGLVLIFSLVFYFFKKRHEYRGPVAVIRDTEDVEYAIDLDDAKK